MKKLLNKKNVNLLVLLSSLIYFVSYMTRINYAAVLIEIVKTQGITKTAASMALTASSVTYGTGQLVSGFLGDKIKPKYLILTGVFTAALMNFLIFLSENVIQMTIIWGINGFAQAMLWPPLVKTLTDMLVTEEYKKASVNVSIASSVATIAIYLIAPLFITFLNWRSLFLTTSIIGFITSFVWIKGINALEKRKEVYKPDEITFVAHEGEKKKFTGKVFVFLGFVMAAIAMQGILRDGITNWMPTYISETFNLGSAISVLTGIILPLFSILSFKVATWLNKKVFPNELTCSTVIFLTGMICAFLLYINASFSPILSIILLAVITAAMHGVNLMLITMLPPYFAKYGKVSFISGLLNSCTYVGSAVSTYGGAVLADNFGWNATLLTWGITAALGTLFCAVCISKKKIIS